jgi:hypothetical protein
MRSHSQIDLLKIIGMAQMEKELLKRFQSVSKYADISKSR